MAEDNTPPADPGVSLTDPVVSTPSPDDTNDWKPLIPEDIRHNPVFDNVQAKTVGDAFANISKQLVGAQKFIGADKMPAPTESWSDDEWGEHYTRLGRPEQSEGYESPKFEKLPDGIEALPEEEMAHFKGVFHKVGLTKKQGEAVMKEYLEREFGVYANRQAETAKEKEGLLNKLRSDWGGEEGFNANVNMAKAAFAKLADEETIDFVNKSGLATDPRFFSMFYKMGAMMSGDNFGTSTSPETVFAGTPAQSLEQLKRFEADPENMKALYDKKHPGHANAIATKNSLYQKVYSGGDHR